MKFYLPGNAGSVDLGIDVDIGQSSEADRAFVAGLLRTAAAWLDPAPVVETPPITSPVFEHKTSTGSACNPDAKTCVICWYGPECGPFYGVERTSIDTERRCPCSCHEWAEIIPDIIPSPETPEEEPTDERDDEPLRVPVHEVRPPVRPDPSNDAIDDQRSSEHLLQLAGDDRSSQQQEPVAEADVRATPTMTPEELQAWQQRVDAGDSPQVSKQKLSWTPERRAAQAEKARRAGQIRNAARKGKPENLTKEPENAALLDTPIELSEEPETALTHFPGNVITADPTPEEAAHEDAAIIMAPDPLPEKETPIAPPTRSRSEVWTPEMREAASRRMSEKHATGEAPKMPQLLHDHDPGPRAEVTAPLPDCTCPPKWWNDTARSLGEAERPSSKHNHACPLHRHRWVLPSASDDGEGGKYLGRCECGETKLHEPFSTEDNRAAAAKEQSARAGQAGGAAVRRTAAVTR